MTKYINNLFWLISDRVFMLVFQLSLYSSIKRIYGLDVLGNWATLTNLSQLLLSLFLLGIDVVVVKRIVDKPVDAGKEIGSALALQFGGILVYIIVMSASVFIFYSSMQFVYMFLTIIIIANVFSLFSKVVFFHYMALVESKYRAITILISIALAYTFLWISIYMEWYVFYSYALYYILQAIICFVVYFTFFKEKAKWSVSYYRVRIYFNLGLKLIISTISVSLFTQCDVILLEKMVGSSDAGAFSAALRISAIWFMCAGLVANAFFPKIVQLQKKENNDDFIFLEWICGVVSVLAIYVSIIMTFISPFILKLLYGDGMEKSSIILSIHIWTSLFIFLGAFSSKWLYAKGWIALDIYKTVLAAIVNITLNLLIIPKYGAVGAAIVSMLSYFIANFIFFYMVGKTRSLFFMQLCSLKYIFAPWNLIKDYARIKCLFL